MVLTTSRLPTGSSMAVGSSSTMHLGRMAMHACNGNSLLLSAGEQMRRMLSVVIHSNRLEGLVHPLAESPPGEPPDSPGQRPRPPPPRWQRSGCPGSGTPCPRSGGSQEHLAFIPGVHAIDHTPRRRLGSRMALKCLARVDLPQPLCPRITTKLPCSMVRSRCSNTRMGASPSRSVVGKATHPLLECAAFHMA